LWPFIWSVADVLRSDYKQSEHGRVRSLEGRLTTIVWHAGTFESYNADLKRRKGADADQPHRIAYRKLVRA
jgi:hypothetical protein